MARTGDVAAVLLLLLLLGGASSAAADAVAGRLSFWPLPLLYGARGTGGRKPVWSSGWGSDRGDHTHVGADVMYKRLAPLVGPVLLPLPDHGSRKHELPEGTQVLASGAGTVTYVATTGKGTGVIIDHGGGVSTFYQHLADAYVRDGDRVVAGEPIGEAGYDPSGHDKIRHVHWEVRVNGKPIRPEPVLSTLRYVAG